MFKTTRIAAVLGFAFACVPAHALSMKDYEAKSDADKLRYLQTCVGNLILDVAKTDRPLSLKIRSYYYDKLPGYPYPEGTYELLDRIGKLEQQADKDKSVDLSKIRIEELVVLTTAAKFKILPDFQRTADPPVPPRPAVPVPAPAPAPRPAEPVDDPIGQGGFITPPDSPRKTADDPIGTGGFITPPTPAVQICVSAEFVPSWENPSAGPEMQPSGASSETMSLLKAKAGTSTGSETTPSTPLRAPGGLRLPIPRFQNSLLTPCLRGNAARPPTTSTTCSQNHRLHRQSEIILIPPPCLRLCRGPAGSAAMGS